LGDERTVVLVEMASRRRVGMYQRADGSVVGGPAESYGNRFSLSPDGRRIAVPAGGSALALVAIEAAGDVPMAGGEGRVAVAPGERLVGVDASGGVVAQGGGLVLTWSR
jgi:hypothetical protein